MTTERGKIMVEVQQQATCVNTLVGWMLRTLQPPSGWRMVEVEFKPTEQAIWMQARMDDGHALQGMAGSLNSGSEAIGAVVDLQQAVFQEGTVTWLTALVRAEPKDEQGGVSGKAAFNFDDDPGAIADEDGEFTGEQLVAHLRRFPRSPEHVPAWMAQRIEAAGLQLP